MLIFYAKMMIRGTIKAVFLVCVISVSQLCAQDKMTINYMPADASVGNLEYYNILLELALEKSRERHGDYELVATPNSLPQVEALQTVRSGGELDVIATMTDASRERVFNVVRVPLVRGLIGVRLSLINGDDAESMDGISSFEDLNKFVIGQGSDWPDTRILRNAGVRVHGDTSHMELFEMLRNGSIQKFPRAVFEIWDEIESFPEDNFVVAPGYYIYYPTAIYFFTQRSEHGKLLADRLEYGLNKAIDDGSFDQVFSDSMGEYLQKADLENRVMIRLDNPYLPEGTPLEESRYWYISN